MSQLTLHKNDWTPPSRAVMMVADLLGLDVNFINVDFLKEDHLTPQYLKKNPLHAVPLLEDGDFILADSHAIVAYLASVYGKDDSLYPKDAKRRAIVDQRLHFDNGILYQRVRNITIRVWAGIEHEITKFLYDELEETYGFLETFLESSSWLAGDHITIADLCNVSTLSCADMVLPLDRKKYVKTSAWWDKLAALPTYQSRCAPGQKEYTLWYNTTRHEEKQMRQEREVDTAHIFT